MKLLNAIKKLGLGIYTSIKRFPVTLLFSSSVAIMLIIISEITSSIGLETEELLNRITMVLALGMPLSLIAKVYFEKKDTQNPLKLIVYYAFAIIIQILFYFFLLKDLNMVTSTRFIAVNLAAYLCFLFIPHVLHRKNFELYVINIFTSFLITYLYSAVLYAGLSAILFAIDHLLGIRIQSELYFYTLLIVALVFAPAYFLAYVPKKNKVSTELPYSKILRILLTYIVMPLLTIYTVILYLYFGKIIITMEWPVGLVSHLVLWFSLILTFVLFFITPIQKDLKWTSVFFKWAPRIILPILMMMFVSMGIRVKAYGITENRYYVLVLGLWIFGSMIYLSLAKKRKNILLPISLSIIILISVLGPFSSYSISQYSQSHRLENILVNNDMLNEGKVQVSSKNVSIQDKQSISSILNYFENNHGLDRLDVLPEKFQISDMEETFGFHYEQPQREHFDNYFYYRLDMSSSLMDISEFDYFMDSSRIFEMPQSNDNLLNIQHSPDSNIITINYNNQIYETDLTDFATQLYEKYGFSQRDNGIPLNEMTFIEENDAYKAKFIIQNLDGEIRDTEKIIINDLSFYIFITMK